jgi:hypothetical protein
MLSIIAYHNHPYHSIGANGNLIIFSEHFIEIETKFGEVYHVE